ncbi:ABC transporter permease [Spongiactinospora sp. TRM90649]|uniref:ABC transporter permease n=1 Tax=Spongiactinospora sp. TRM90649 TaxID=3031114 RepID=UPI0023F9670C|nr:ABC transporter permease [Spongiactinospora sp. TRM90649]MDF5754098.1 ABC transporter permease [Spongiactinospora sp. TRM90649]
MRGRVPLVLRRALSEPLLLLAALGSILLATTTLVALSTYASSVVDMGVRRAVQTATVQTTSAGITSTVTQDGFAALDTAVRDRMRAAYQGLPVTVGVNALSDSYAMPGQETRKTPDLTRFGVFENIDRHARLESGRWPAPASESASSVEAAVSQTAARVMGVTAGSEITVASRLRGRPPVRVAVTGVFALNDPYDGRWTAERLLTSGVETGEYSTYGPLVVPRETFAARFTTSVAATWLAVPDLRPLPPDRLGALADSVGALTRIDDKALPGCSGCAAHSSLPAMSAQLTTAALVARSTMMVPILQLLLLAAYALMLTARLLADHRRMEVALLRSRGAGTVRLAALAGGEALIVAVPCALAAPFLAAPLLQLVASIPWIKASGVRPASAADPMGFLVSGLVALACAVLLALPAVRGARRTYVEEQSARGRGDRSGLFQRAGADIALLAVAALAIWQLQHYGAPVTATSGGGLGLDPLIITGPALALLCGGMLGLRLVPRVSALAERITSRRVGLAPALGAWQVSRRPMRYSGPALLLTMAVAIGVVSMATASTWRGSQEDQARHQAGADLRVAGSAEGAELGPLGRGTAYAALPGVAALSPAYRSSGEFGGNQVTMLTLNADRIPGLINLRADLSDAPLAALAARLAEGRPETSALPIPGTPSELTVAVRAETQTGVPGELRMTIEDALGVRHDLRLGPLRTGASEVTADLAALTGRTGKLSHPLSVRGFTVSAPPGGGRFTVAVESVRVRGGEALALPQGVQWGHQALGGQATAGEGDLKVSGDDGLFTVEAAAGPARVALVPLPQGTPGLAGTAAAPLPVVITRELATAERLTTGQRASVTFDQRPTAVSIAGIVETLPGSANGRPAVLADWETTQARDLMAGAPSRPATEWWLAARGGDTAPAVAELARHPTWEQTVVDRVALTRDLRDDPLASGLQGALILGFAAALVFALLGFLVNAAVAARERASEFAILRALGMSFRQVLGLLAVEQAFLIGLSLLAGTGLAVAVAALVVPHIVVTGQATAVTPGVLLDIPWLATAALLVVVAALLFVIVAGLARTLRKQGLGGALRVGEDR